MEWKWITAIDKPTSISMGGKRFRGFKLNTELLESVWSSVYPQEPYPENLNVILLWEKPFHRLDALAMVRPENKESFREEHGADIFDRINRGECEPLGFAAQFHSGRFLVGLNVNGMDDYVATLKHEFNHVHDFIEESKATPLGQNREA